MPALENKHNNDRNSVPKKEEIQMSRGVAHELEPIRRLEGCGPELRADWRAGIWWPASGLWHTGGWEESARTGAPAFRYRRGCPPIPEYKRHIPESIYSYA
jgi:hypothetical protein